MKKLLFIVAAIIFACMANTADAQNPSYDNEINQLQKEITSQVVDMNRKLAHSTPQEVKKLMYDDFFGKIRKYNQYIHSIKDANPDEDVSIYTEFTDKHMEFVRTLAKKIDFPITSEYISKMLREPVNPNEDVKLSSAIANSETATATPVKANPNEEITLTVSSDGPTKDDAVKNALRLAIEQAYGAFVSANTTILNDDLVKDEIVTISTGAIKNYKILTESEKPEGNGYLATVNATVSLPHLVTYAKNHGSECEFAGNTFGMDLKLFKIQKENELKALYNAIPMIAEFAKNNMKHVLYVDEPKLAKVYISKDGPYEPTELNIEGYVNSEGYGKHTKVKTSDLNRRVGPDGRHLVVDDEQAKDINDILNGENLFVQFRVRWIPIDPNNDLSYHVMKFLHELSLDEYAARKYREQGHNIFQGSNAIGDIASETWEIAERNSENMENWSYIILRNTPEDIEEWFEALYSELDKVKNNFRIVDNNGVTSDFAPEELAKFRNDSKRFKKNRIEHFNSDIYTFPDKIDKVILDHRNGNFVCFGATGIFNKLFIVEYVGEYGKTDRPEYNDNAYSRQPVIPCSWVVTTIVPVSEISKYSSFKIQTD